MEILIALQMGEDVAKMGKVAHGVGGGVYIGRRVNSSAVGSEVR
jgi:hypothetical protein